jgi:hypothetical protein
MGTSRLRASVFSDVGRATDRGIKSTDQLVWVLYRPVYKPKHPQSLDQEFILRMRCGRAMLLASAAEEKFAVGNG